MLSTGDFSSLTRITVKMLRHYDEIGLLKPAVRDGRSRYRYYLADQLVDAQRIVSLKDAGFSLDQIALLMTPATKASDRKNAFDRQRERLLAAQREAAFRLRQLDTLEPIVTAPHTTGISVRALPDQLMATMRSGLLRRRMPVSEMFDRLEIDAARNKARADASPMMILHGVNAQNSANDIEAAVPVSRMFEPASGTKVRLVKGAKFAACAVYAGGYDQTESAISAIRRWAKQHRATIIGPLREVYVRFGADQIGYRLPARWLATSSADFVTEIQAPIRLRSRE
jgi:DNA-binding transcriptional MerR regulator/effector-binding domain-containing protein